MSSGRSRSARKSAKRRVYRGEVQEMSWSEPRQGPALGSSAVPPPHRPTVPPPRWRGSWSDQGHPPPPFCPTVPPPNRSRLVVVLRPARTRKTRQKRKK